jgi:hypothetical protein
MIGRIIAIIRGGVHQHHTANTPQPSITGIDHHHHHHQQDGSANSRQYTFGDWFGECNGDLRCRQEPLLRLRSDNRHCHWPLPAHRVFNTSVLLPLLYSYYHQHTTPHHHRLTHQLPHQPHSTITLVHSSTSPSPSLPPPLVETTACYHTPILSCSVSRNNTFVTPWNGSAPWQLPVVYWCCSLY